jgi:sugar-specific transcriptional regulator TrmB
MNIIPQHQLIFGRLFKAINPNRKLIAKYSEFTENYLSQIKNLWDEYYSCLSSNEVPFEFSSRRYGERTIEYTVTESLRDMASLIVTTTEATNLYIKMSGQRHIKKSISKTIEQLMTSLYNNDLGKFITEYQKQILHYGFYSKDRKSQLDEKIKKLIPTN